MHKGKHSQPSSAQKPAPYSESNVISIFLILFFFGNEFVS